jgi:hypothetical protein
LKGAKDFYSLKHLHPYEEGFNDRCKFNVEFKKDHEYDYVSFWYKPHSDVFNIKLRHSPDTADDELKQCMDRNIETFQLNGLYDECHKDYVSELILASREYNDDAIDMIMITFKHLFTKREDAVRFLTRNYVSIDDLGKRPLAKLNRDIAHQFKML